MKYLATSLIKSSGLRSEGDLSVVDCKVISLNYWIIVFEWPKFKRPILSVHRSFQTLAIAFPPAGERTTYHVAT
jgi:hypothetical protein